MAEFVSCIYLSLKYIGANVVHALHVMRARADVVATQVGIIGANVVRALHVMCARANIVATELVIILSSSFFLSMHIQKGFA